MPSKFTNRLAEAAERARKGVSDVLNDEEVIDLARSSVRRVGGTALKWGPVEWLVPAVGVAAIIKIADKQGLLESDAAAPLKELAAMVDDTVAMDQQRLLNALPKLIELKIFNKIVGDGKAKQGILVLGQIAAESGSVREVVEKFTKWLGQDGPRRGGLT